MVQRDHMLTHQYPEAGEWSNGTIGATTNVHSMIVTRETGNHHDDSHLLEDVLHQEALCGTHLRERKGGSQPQDSNVVDQILESEVIVTAQTLESEVTVTVRTLESEEEQTHLEAQTSHSHHHIDDHRRGSMDTMQEPTALVLDQWTKAVVLRVT